MGGGMNRGEGSRERHPPDEEDSGAGRSECQDGHPDGAAHSRCQLKGRHQQGSSRRERLYALAHNAMPWVDFATRVLRWWEAVENYLP